MVAEVKRWINQINFGALVNQLNRIAQGRMNEVILIADYINPKIAERLKNVGTQPSLHIVNKLLLCYSLHNVNREGCPMHVIAKKIFAVASKKFPNDASGIMYVYQVLNKGTFSTPQDLKNELPSLDNMKYAPKMYVLDVGGNNLRMLTKIDFLYQKVFVKYIVMHTEYDSIIERYKKGEL